MLSPQHKLQKEPYVDSNCKLLLHFNGQSGNAQFIDSSPNTKVVTPYGNACLSNSHYRFGGTSGYFDGDGDYLSIPYSSDFAFGTNDFTVSFNFYPLTCKNHGLVGLYNGGVCGWIIGTAGNDVEMWASSNGSSWNVANNNSIGIVTLSSWNNITITKNGNTYNGYLNGVLGSGFPLTSSSSLYSSSSDLLYIGRISELSDANGYIDELAIWKGIALPIGMLYPQKRPFGYPIGGVT